MILLCTVRDCRRPLEPEERRVHCANGHSFDLARSGYLNLLQPQDRRSKIPGDTAAAVAARRRFYARGLDTPLLDAVIRALPLGPRDTLLDVGCGDGHHLAAFRRAWGVEGYGIDISVPAIELAAKRDRECTWIVANADRFLPFATASISAIMSVTARIHRDEFRRVLRPGGTLLVVLPAPDDLIELRELAQGERVERDRTERALDELEPAFRLLRHETVRHVARLDREALLDVMASSYRGLRTRERERLEQLDALDVTLSRDLLVFSP